MDLYFREEDLDLETVVQLIVSALFTIAICTALCIVCVPGMASKRHLFLPKSNKVEYICYIPPHLFLIIDSIQRQPAITGDDDW